MNKRSLALLEKAFDAEVSGALSGGIDLMQTKSKLAEKLVEDGYLAKAEVSLSRPFPMTVKGYRLTHLGRMTYCLTCEGPP